MIGWAVETLIGSALLMLVVLAIRTPVRRSFGPNAAYALWAIPALRMLLPPLPEHWRGHALPTLPAPEDIGIYLGEPMAMLPADHGAGWPAVLLAAWIIGAIGFVGYHVVAHRRFCARVRGSAQRTTAVAAGRVEIIESDAAAGPLAFGVWRKYVAFPRDFAERYDPLERDLALAHELGHHARGDLVANWAALIVLALHWFNPIAWRAFRAFRADQEMACDALVLAGRVPQLRHAYGRAIVKSAHGGAVSAACHLHTINDVKGRLKMLNMQDRASASRRLLGGVAVAALGLGGLALTASGTNAANRVRSGVEETIGVELANIALPALPQAALAAPAPPPATTAPAPTAAPDRPVRVIMRHKDGRVEEMTGDGDIDIDVSSTEPGGRRHRYVYRETDGKILKDGKVTSLRRMPIPPAPPLPPEALAALRDLPDISSRVCHDSEGRATDHVIHSKDGKRRIVICTNRIERLANAAVAKAHADGAWAHAFDRRGGATAIEGLQRARSSVEKSGTLTDAQRSAALAGIDQAIRENASRLDD